MTSWFDDRPPGSYAICSVCRGKKRDPKKRKRACPACGGSGQDKSRCGKCQKEVLQGCLVDSDIDYENRARKPTASAVG